MAENWHSVYNEVIVIQRETDRKSTFIKWVYFFWFHLTVDFYLFQYPYIPAHITKPKEHKQLMLVQLPEKGKAGFAFKIRFLFSNEISNEMTSLTTVMFKVTR